MADAYGHESERESESEIENVNYTLTYGQRIVVCDSKYWPFQATDRKWKFDSSDAGNGCLLYTSDAADE